jgi:hypothetical protein
MTSSKKVGADRAARPEASVARGKSREKLSSRLGRE